MVTKLRCAWHAARALQHFARSDANAALQSIKAFRALHPLSAAQHMWTYFPLALMGRFDEAFVALDEVSRQTETLTDEDGRFINLCARALRASYEGNIPLHDQLLIQAKRLKPRPSVKMWTQLDGRNVS